MITYITPNGVETGNERADEYFTKMYNEDSSYYDNDRYFKIFLAGTIDNGESEDWQKGVYHSLFWMIEPLIITYGQDYVTPPGKYDVVMYSPRRSDWKEDATVEDIENQIRWEQDKLEKADLIVMVLQDNSKSPISLLELGLYGREGKLICFCTKNFYRYTNVKLTCEKFLIPFKETISPSEIAESIENILKESYP